MAIVDSMAFADSNATRGPPELRVYRQAGPLRSQFPGVGFGRLLLVLAALLAVPGPAAGRGTDPMLKAWLVRFGRVAAEVPIVQSAFTAAGGNEDGGTPVLWGRGTFSHLVGSEDDLELDGDVRTGTLGTDWSDGRWLAGLAMSPSTGEGTWRRDGKPGRVESSVTGLYPYTGYEITDWLVVWGTAGYGIGALTLIPHSGERQRTDIALLMAAAGARGDLVDRAGASGPALSVAAGGLYASTISQATSGTGTAEADVSRIRLALEGSWGIAVPGGTLLTPTVEVGARHDGGDAETGLAAEVGGGLTVADASGTLAVALSGRVLFWHEAGDVRD